MVEAGPGSLPIGDLEREGCLLLRCSRRLGIEGRIWWGVRCKCGWSGLMEEGMAEAETGMKTRGREAEGGTRGEERLRGAEAMRREADTRGPRAK